jgi:hypothetical protein
VGLGYYPPPVTTWPCIAFITHQANLTFNHRNDTLHNADVMWQKKGAVDAAAYRDLLMPVQSRDVAFITRPELHEYLWTGTKTAIETYNLLTVRGLRHVRKHVPHGSDIDEKNEWFKARRMVLGRTALFLQGGSVFGLGHLGVMKALFEVITTGLDVSSLNAED